MIAILVPARERVEGLKRLIDSWKETNTGKSKLLFCFQDTDPTLEEHIKLANELGEDNYIIRGNIGCVAKVNELYKHFKGFRAYLFGANDIAYKTKDFDRTFIEQLDFFKNKHGHDMHIMYGDDTIQHEKMPTHPLITSELLEIMGSFFPDGYMRHLYCDNAIMEIGIGANVLIYIPSIIMEHFHFIAKKSKLDRLYLESNCEEMYRRDKIEFTKWFKEKGRDLIKTIKETIDLRNIKEAK